MFSIVKAFGTLDKFIEIGLNIDHNFGYVFVRVDILIVVEVRNCLLEVVEGFFEVFLLDFHVFFELFLQFFE